MGREEDWLHQLHQGLLDGILRNQDFAEHSFVIWVLINKSVPCAFIPFSSIK